MRSSAKALAVRARVVSANDHPLLEEEGGEAGRGYERALRRVRHIKCAQRHALPPLRRIVNGQPVAPHLMARARGASFESAASVPAAQGVGREECL